MRAAIAAMAMAIAMAMPMAALIPRHLVWPGPGLPSRREDGALPGSVAGGPASRLRRFRERRPEPGDPHPLEPGCPGLWRADLEISIDRRLPARKDA